MTGVALLVYATKLVSQTDPHIRTATHPQGSIYGWGYWLVWALIALGLALEALSGEALEKASSLVNATKLLWGTLVLVLVALFLPGRHTGAAAGV